ncbi:MAG: carboxypeptidase-like regulatory domain-containing protein, partial [Trueperaceae bacterium]|nr:carboxypeptidase-like regulatory domain-containing protein [Trueperaceae bacterium]
RVRRQTYRYRPPARDHEARWGAGRLSGGVSYEHTVRVRADVPLSVKESWDADLDLRAEGWDLRTSVRRATALPLEATQAVRHVDGWAATLRLPRAWGDVDVRTSRDRTVVAGVVRDREAELSTTLRNVEIDALDVALSARYRTGLPVDACRPDCDPDRQLRVGGSVRAFGGTARFDVEPWRDGGASLDVGYGYATTVRPFGWVPVEVSVAGGDRWLDTVSADVRGTLDSRFGRLDLSGGVRHERDGAVSTTFTARAGWSYRTDVPVSYRSDLGRLEGRILGPDGAPLPNVVVRVDERELVTDEDGTFGSDVLPVGPATVFVDTTRIPSGMLVAPNPVQDVVLASGEPVELAFQLVEATGVRGRLVYDEPPTDVGEDVVFGTGQRDLDPQVVGGRTIIVRNDARSYRTTSEPDGTFELDRMYPGTYRVEVVDDADLEFFRVEPETLTVEVHGTEPTPVEARIVPERRTVEIEERPGLSFP